MSRRKQGRPQQRKTLDSCEYSTCDCSLFCLRFSVANHSSSAVLEAKTVNFSTLHAFVIPFLSKHVKYAIHQQENNCDVGVVFSKSCCSFFSSGNSLKVRGRSRSNVYIDIHDQMQRVFEFAVKVLEMGARFLLWLHTLYPRRQHL